MDSATAQKVVVLSVAGWLVGFVSMLLVHDGSVGAALQSLPVIIISLLVLVTLLTVIVKRHAQ